MTAAAPPAWAPRRVLLVSRHDYRSSWRANFHFIAEAYARLGAQVSFVSVGFSRLSLIRGDRRAELDARANRWERVNGINCYLWKSPLHPVRTGNPLLTKLMTPAFALWTRSPAPALDKAAAEADLILVESDLSATLLPRLRRRALRTPILYVASDLLETIDAAPQIETMLVAARGTIDHVVAVSRGMLPTLEKLGRPLSYVPHGIEPADFPNEGANPYTAPHNAVTVGSMLFDPHVITTAAQAFPDVTFHLIGTPPAGPFPANVIEHGPMPFAETVRWLRHADVGIAPYRHGASSHYLADSSFKLMQYGYLGLPAVCPHFAAGDHGLRFGYEPGDAASIVAAFTAALSDTVERRPVEVPTWVEVAHRLSALAASAAR